MENQSPHHKPARRGVALVLAAPSGGGKSSITRALLATDPGLEISISATTRAPRAGERDGVDYHFLDRAGFAALAESGGLLESAEVFGRSYGTPRAPVLAALAAGRDVLFDIDWQGYRQLRTALGNDVVGVYLLPPSLPVLAERLAARGDAPEMAAQRMAEARAEISHWPEFDHVVINQGFTQAVADVRAILAAARLATARQTGLMDFVATLMGETGMGEAEPET